MAPPAAAALMSEILQLAACRQVRFEPGDVLRRKGQHYRDMYVITEGCVDVDRSGGLGGAPTLLVAGAGFPIGEIAFLRGCAATATVTARTEAGALVIDDATLARLEREKPSLAAQLLQQLAEIADERTSYNLTSIPSPLPAKGAIEVYLCRTKELLAASQRLRYEVYCEELRRDSPYADHEKKVISDSLDETGHVFIAVEAGETIGTLRANAASDGSLGLYEELYGMRKSPYHPHATAICTKFIVKKSKRGGPASMKLIAALVRYGLRHGIRECYIDCIPALLPYYRAIGFRVSGEKFLHRENGPSHPMMIDLVKHGGTLAAERRPGDYLKLFVKAQSFRLLDKVRAARRPATQS